MGDAGFRFWGLGFREEWREEVVTLGFGCPECPIQVQRAAIESLGFRVFRECA